MARIPALLAALTLLAQTPLLTEEQAPVVAANEVEVFFSPKDNVADKLISLIEQETVSIKAAVYCLTHRGIIKALLEAKRRGVDVELVIDPFTIKARSPLRRMAQTGMTLHIWDPVIRSLKDDNKQRAPLMHNKFCVFRSLGVVWTGSFNFTSEASNANQENVVLLRNKSQVSVFEEQFKTIRAEGCRSYLDYLANPPKKKTKKKS